ncbi:hypothetical protein ACUUMA_15685 [Paenarthrobacter nitroguajacolicus]|uniref:hypothetical protein n=1 Tax=Paenarthrobacter nitroguajacolicus TaxID=211146 RepID=UPI0040555413
MHSDQGEVTNAAIDLDHASRSYRNIITYAQFMRRPNNCTSSNAEVTSVNDISMDCNLAHNCPNPTA